MKRFPKISRQKRKDSYDLAYIRLKGSDGKWHNRSLGPYGSREAEDKYRQLRQQYMAGEELNLDPKTAPPPKIITVGKLLSDYLDDRQNDFQTDHNGYSTTFARYKYVCLLLSEMYGQTPLDDFDAVCLYHFRQSLVKSERFCRVTINQYISNIKSIFKWGVLNGYVKEERLYAFSAVSHLNKGQAGTIDHAPRQSVPDEVVEQTLEHLRDPAKTIVTILLNSPSRPEEICGLRVEEIDRSGSVWWVKKERHKTAYKGKTKEIPLGPKCQAALSAYLTKHPVKRGYIFTTTVRGRKTGQPFYPSGSLGKEILNTNRKYGIAHWTPYQLRHAFATRVKKLYGINYSQELMGHSDVRTTLIYVDKDRDTGNKVAGEIG